MKRMMHEPPLHFLLLGAALFVAFGFLRDNSTPSREQIVVSAGKIEHLAALFARTWQRPATREELEGLINDFIREEAAYREGLALGFDRDDTIIRRRICQKLDFIAEDLLASQVEPTEAIVALPPGTWQGPIPSGYGVHLVIVDERHDGHLPQLDAVRDAVRREWENARRQERMEQFYRHLIEKYTIIVERPTGGGKAGAP